MPKPNQGVREAMKKNKIPQWELADALGVCEQTVLRKLRHELPKQEQDQLIRKVEEIAEKKE